MSLEVLKTSILKALTLGELRVRQSNINDVELDANPMESRKFEDQHRLAAYGSIDMLLEGGQITPEEALRRKARWDVMHGY